MFKTGIPNPRTPYLPARIRPIMILACAVFVSHSALAAEERPVEVTDKAQIHKTEVNGFVHPGISLNKEMLEDVRAEADGLAPAFCSITSAARAGAIK